jgi:HSP20 family protein
LIQINEPTIAGPTLPRCGTGGAAAEIAMRQRLEFRSPAAGRLGRGQQGGTIMAMPSLWRPQRERGELLAGSGASEPFPSLRRDMERLFEAFSRDFGWGAAAQGGAVTAPRIDVSETDSEIRIEAELPGVEEKDVEVVLSHGRLTIKGDKKQEKEEKKTDYHLVERSYGSFARSIGLPFEADPDQVKASFAKGVLRITVPKPAQVKASEKKIPIATS